MWNIVNNFNCYTKARNIHCCGIVSVLWVPRGTKYLQTKRQVSELGRRVSSAAGQGSLGPNPLALQFHWEERDPSLKSDTAMQEDSVLRWV